MVAGYGDWKRKFGRHVKAGETGITILAPCPYWARDEVEETGPDGQTIKEQKWVKKLVSPRLLCLMSARPMGGNSPAWALRP